VEQGIAVGVEVARSLFKKIKKIEMKMEIKFIFEHNQLLN